MENSSKKGQTLWCMKLHVWTSSLVIEFRFGLFGKISLVVVWNLWKCETLSESLKSISLDRESRSYVDSITNVSHHSLGWKKWRNLNNFRDNGLFMLKFDWGSYFRLKLIIYFVWRHSNLKMTKLPENRGVKQFMTSLWRHFSSNIWKFALWTFLEKSMFGQNLV